MNLKSDQRGAQRFKRENSKKIRHVRIFFIQTFIAKGLTNDLATSSYVFIHMTLIACRAYSNLAKHLIVLPELGIFQISH